PPGAATLAQHLLLGAYRPVAAQHRLEHAVGAQPQQREQGDGDQQFEQGETGDRASLPPAHRANPTKPSRRVTARSCNCASLRRCSAAATQTVMRSRPGSALAWTSPGIV